MGAAVEKNTARYYRFTVFRAAEILVFARIG